MPTVKHGLFVPPTGELSDPRLFGELAAEAESSGWNGLFVWDHVLRPATEPTAIADPWICLAIAAAATSLIRIGTMVTPITRRRPIKLARETVSLDHLSQGRLTLGLGLGVDSSGELSKFGEVVDPKVRGQRLDEGAELLCALWTGTEVHFAGKHFVADGALVLPTPVQQPRIPLWFAARGAARNPVRRAARYDGLFPVDVTADQLRAMLAIIADIRGSLDGFDVAGRPGDDLSYDQLANIGATWMLTDFGPGVTLDEIEAAATAGPEATFHR